MGLMASSLVFNGWQTSTIGANGASLSFQLIMNGRVMLTAGVLGLSIARSGVLYLRFPRCSYLRSRCATKDKFTHQSKKVSWSNFQRRTTAGGRRQTCRRILQLRLNQNKRILFSGVRLSPPFKSLHYRSDKLQSRLYKT